MEEDNENLKGQLESSRQRHHMSLFIVFWIIGIVLVATFVDAGGLASWLLGFGALFIAWALAKKISNSNLK
jgi:hypothetical protein